MRGRQTTRESRGWFDSAAHARSVVLRGGDAVGLCKPQHSSAFPITHSGSSVHWELGEFSVWSPSE